MPRKCPLLRFYNMNLPLRKSCLSLFFVNFFPLHVRLFANAMIVNKQHKDCGKGKISAHEFSFLCPRDQLGDKFFFRLLRHSSSAVCKVGKQVCKARDHGKRRIQLDWRYFPCLRFVVFSASRRSARSGSALLLRSGLIHAALIICFLVQKNKNICGEAVCLNRDRIGLIIKIGQNLRLSVMNAQDRKLPYLRRFGMELTDVSEVVKGCGFGVFTSALESGGSVRGLCVKGQAAMPRKKIDALVDMAKGSGAKGLAYLCIEEDGSYKSSFAKFMTQEQLEALVQAMGGEKGDLLLFAADKNKIVWNVLGQLRLELGHQLGLIDENRFDFLWITEFPLLEWSDEENRFMAMHHPFTMPMEEDWEYIDSAPGRVRAKAYDIVLNGVELGGGSVRIHQNDIQEKMFEVLGFTKEQAWSQFGFLLSAFQYGVPPHAGLAYGLDRFVMLLVHADNIREVIAFPKVKDASCLMSEAPDVVSEKQLEELGIGILPSADNKE